MEGPVEFLQGIAIGTKTLVGSVVGGAAGVLSKVTQATSKGLAALTLDHSYQNARIQRKEIQSQTAPEIVASGKNVVKDILECVKGVVKKPVKGEKGLVKGLGKGFFGVVGKPTIATDEQIVHRIRNTRHIGRDGLARPSIAHETLGNFIFDKFDEEKHTKHIDSSVDPPSLFFATTKRTVFLVGTESIPFQYQIQWDVNYKDINCSLTESNAIGMTKKDSLYVKVVPYQSIGEARYIVNKIIETITALEL